MSKSVYIMDTPECCYDCPITVCDADNMSTESRSEHCPLRELPEYNPKNPDYTRGWNACLDAITGEAQE